MPDRAVTLADWVRWKHRFTLLVLSLVATTIAACVLGLWSLNTTNAQRAENIRGDTALQEKFATANRTLIIANCKAVESFKAGMRGFLVDVAAGAPAERRDALLARFDEKAPPIDCEHIPTDGPVSDP